MNLNFLNAAGSYTPVGFQFWTESRTGTNVYGEYCSIPVYCGRAYRAGPDVLIEEYPEIEPILDIEDFIDF
jgi:hypothetical protein